MLLLAALALPVAMSAKSPEPVNPPAPLPSFVTVVSPAQGFVNLSGDVNPLGVAEITFGYSGNVDYNRDVKSELYKEGILLCESKSIYKDAMGNALISISFDVNGRQPGWYEVKVAAGQFTVNGVPSEAFNLFYEIDNVCTISPTPGVVFELSDFVLNFGPVDDLRVTGSTDQLTCMTWLIVADGQNPNPEYSLSVMVENQGSDWKAFIKFSSAGIASEITTPGKYVVNVPAGLLTSYVYGPNYATDPTDVITRSNPRLNITYNIPTFPQPDIEPEEGVVAGFKDFVLTMPEGFNIWFANNMGTSGVYPVNPDGTISVDPVCKVKTVMNAVDQEKGTCIFYVWDTATNAPVTELFTPAPGDYAFVLDNEAFSGMWTGNGASDFCSAAPYQYFFTIPGTPSAVDNVDPAEPEVYTVYNLQGVRVAAGISAAEVNALPAGLYIANGKKVMVVR